ncbi:UDP-glucuronic acid decarboxylase family protein [Agrobacterium sp. 22-226-1]
MKVLVTGGAGFLGSHLCDALLRLNHEVICLDDLSTGSLSNVEHLLNLEHFTFFCHDVTEEYDFKVDKIFNLACPASPPAYQSDPLKTVLTNVLGAKNAVQLAHRQRALLIQASTSEVYGDPETHPQPEDYWGNVNPTGPRACYDEGKRCAEAIISDFRRTERIDAKIARIFNTYGPRMASDDGRVVSNFIVQALSHKPITIFGDGSQTRSFCFVADLIDGLLRLGDSPSSVVGPVNLGNPQEVPIVELATEILQMTGSTSQLAFRKLPTDDPKRRRPDISRAMANLDWRPRTSLREGLTVTIEYFSGVTHHISAHNS